MKPYMSRTMTYERLNGLAKIVLQNNIAEKIVFR